jgi:hypothetical protein
MAHLWIKALKFPVAAYGIGSIGALLFPGMSGIDFSCNPKGQTAFLMQTVPW